MCPRPLVVKWQKRILLLRLVTKGDDTEDGHLVLRLTPFWSSGRVGADTSGHESSQLQAKGTLSGVGSASTL